MVRNGRGEVVDVQKIRPSQSFLIVDHFNKQFELGDFKRPTVVESPKEREHLLNLVKYKEQMYLTKVNEKKNPKKQTVQITAEVFTVPQNDLVLSCKIPSKYCSESYFQEISTEAEPQLQIKNKEGEICCRLDLKEQPKAIEYKEPNQNEEQLKIMNFNEINDIADQNGRSLATSLSIQIGNSEFKNYKIRPTLVGQDYYSQVVNEIMNKDGRKKLTLITMNEEGKIISKHQFDSDLIADKYYNRIVEETIDDVGQRTIVFETLNDRGESICKQTFRPTLNKEITDNYYEGILEELVNEHNQKRISVLKPF